MKAKAIKNFFSLCSMILFLLPAGCSSQTGQNGSQVSFTKTVLSREFLAEGIAAADVNGDGKMDILAGAYWFEAPDWKTHELATPKKYEFNKGYSDYFLSFDSDINHDGKIDLIHIGFPSQPAAWFENPGRSGIHWKRHQIHASVGNESPLFVDIDGDGIEDLLCNDPNEKKVIWIKGPSERNANWQAYTISADPDLATHMYTHGLGFGDINGDGRKDVTIRSGWWEMPEDPKTEGWKFHPAALGADCAQMYIFDCNGDGINDVISSSAHAYGIWWHEQYRDGSGQINFRQHLIDSSFSQSHAMAFVDINGDGHPDLVTGKRYYAHNGGDPGAEEPAELNWYEFIPGKSPRWVKRTIDKDSGSGLNIAVKDFNGDGKLDIAVSNKKGVFYFQQN